MRKILLRSMVIVSALGAIAVGASGAFFSDTESSTGNTFTAGAIDLKIDNESYYNGVLNPGTSWESTDLVDEKFFDFDDLKPGDIGEDTISIHVDTNDAYLCADVTLTSNDDNGINEPEGEVDTTDGAGNGELAANVNFLWWADDGDNVLETGEDVISQGPIGALTLNQAVTITLADSEDNIWTGTGGPIPGEVTQYIGKGWCFGDLSVVPLAQDGSGTIRSPADEAGGGFTCDGSELNNSTQTDSLTADISFEAVQARNNDEFECNPPPPVIACTEGQQWADTVVKFDQGRDKDGDPIAAARSNPLLALGAPQSPGLPDDGGIPVGTFTSLGFGVGTTSSRSIIVRFDNNQIINGPGSDLKIFEVTNGAYPDEHIKVEASPDGVTWTVLTADGIRDISVDLGALTSARYVRLTDINNPANFAAQPDADGYDLDAVQALNCAQIQVQ